MSQRKRWITVLGSGGGVALALGALVFFQRDANARSEEEIAELERQVADQRQQVGHIASLEREIIVERETDEVIREILPSDKDITNYVRTLQSFADVSGVQIQSLKQKAQPNADKKLEVDFLKVGYQIAFQADAFQLLSFLDQVERHPRFMSVTTFKLTAAKAEKLHKKGGDALPRHELQLDVETYVYEPKSGAPQATIESYERKRDMLASEIAKRRGSLAVPAYAYVGQRNRRDPWVDPRVPASTDDELLVPIPDQIAKVDELQAKTVGVVELWRIVQESASPIEKLKAQVQLETELATLEEEVRRTQAAGFLTYLPARKRFDVDVVEETERLRADLAAVEGDRGPSHAALTEAIEAVHRHMEAREYEMVRTVFATVEPRLGLAELDPSRDPLAKELRKLDEEAKTILDFEQIPMTINGVVIRTGSDPVALINGTAVGVGDMLDEELIIHAIHEEEIDFVFRGLILTRPVGR